MNSIRFLIMLACLTTVAACSNRGRNAGLVKKGYAYERKYNKVYEVKDTTLKVRNNLVIDVKDYKLYSIGRNNINGKIGLWYYYDSYGNLCQIRNHLNDSSVRIVTLLNTSW